MYQLQKDSVLDKVCAVNKNTDNGMMSIPFDPANTDYANFKKEILADEAQLQDADGNTMSAEQAKTYVGGLA
jgi:hypothetical protein